MSRMKNAFAEKEMQRETDLPYIRFTTLGPLQAGFLYYCESSPFPKERKTFPTDKVSTKTVEKQDLHKIRF